MFEVLGKGLQLLPDQRVHLQRVHRSRGFAAGVVDAVVKTSVVVGVVVDVVDVVVPCVVLRGRLLLERR